MLRTGDIFFGVVRIMRNSGKLQGAPLVTVDEAGATLLSESLRASRCRFSGPSRDRSLQIEPLRLNTPPG